MQRRTLGIVHQLVVGLTVAGLFVVAIEAVQNEGSWNFHHADDNGNYSISLREGTDRLKVKSRGKIVYQDELRIASLEPDARLRVEERLDGVDRLLVVTPKADGTPSYDYQVEGESRSFDSEAETWFSGVVLRLYRRIGIDAEGRARRLAENGGIDGLLDEVTRIPGDHVASRYLAVAVELAEPQELAAVLDSASDSVASDYHLYGLMKGISPDELQDPAVLASFRRGTDKISSDYHLRRLLSEMIRQSPSTEVTGSMLEAAHKSLASDHELTELVVQLAETRRETDPGPLPTILAPILKSISSDYQLQRAITALMSPLPASDEERALLLRAAARAPSNYHVAEMLIFFSERFADSSDAHLRPAPPSAFDLLARIRSSHDAARAADALAEVVPHAQANRLLDSVRVQGDYHKRVVLESVLEHHGASVADAQAFKRMLDSINSDHERRQVEDRIATSDLKEAPSVEAPDDEGEAESLDEARGLDEIQSPDESQETAPTRVADPVASETT